MRIQEITEFLVVAAFTAAALLVCPRAHGEVPADMDFKPGQCIIGQGYVYQVVAIGLYSLEIKDEAGQKNVVMYDNHDYKKFNHIDCFDLFPRNQ